MTDIGRAEFCTAFAQAQQALGYDDVTLAKIFQVSRPTVGRWARGEAAPHPIGRKPILEALARHLERSLLDEP
jgi:DNA-binding transcriptional regulator YiaG